VLPAWRDATLFSDRERAALALAESVTTLPDARARDQDYAEAARHLTEDELPAVSWVAIAMNSFNRLSITAATPVLGHLRADRGGRTPNRRPIPR
jgi:alkylhydroperoxidase family enzyme